LFLDRLQFALKRSSGGASDLVGVLLGLGKFLCSDAGLVRQRRKFGKLLVHVAERTLVFEHRDSILACLPGLNISGLVSEAALNLRSLLGGAGRFEIRFGKF